MFQKEIISKRVKDMAQVFRQRLLELEACGGLQKEQYVRFLSMQYHLTQGVQKHFMAVASHGTLSHRPKLREFLFNFAMEEELHFKIAEKDLSNMGEQPSPCPLDVKVWWAYFNEIVISRPFVRLGATSVLENISSLSGDVLDRLLKGANYLNAKNTKFLVIHRHDEKLPHGAQILDALGNADPNKAELDDIFEGIETAKVFYLRMFEWALTGSSFPKRQAATLKECGLIESKIIAHQLFANLMGVLFIN